MAVNAGSIENRIARKLAATGVAGIALILAGPVIAGIARSIEPPSALTRTDSNGRGITAEGEDIFGSFAGVRIEDVSAHFANTAIIAAAATLVALVPAWFIGRQKRDSYHGVAGLAVVLVFAPFGYLMVDVMGHHLPGVHTHIRDEYPYFAQWTLTMAAYGLVGAGILLVTTLAAEPRSIGSLSRRAVALSLAAGLSVTIFAATTAVWLGDDSINIDHRTATPNRIPPTPAALGTQQYALTTGDLTADGRAGDIVIAGTGFVLASDSGLTAYDGATGAPRWHYRRKNIDADHPLAYSPGSLRSLDGGAVVAAAWERWGWKVLDAVTGELLRGEAEFGGGEDGREYRVPSGTAYRPGMVIFERDGTLARYDARTNALLWSTEPILPGCVRGNSPVAATSSAIFAVAGCPGETNTLRIVALDPRTGAVAVTRDIAYGSESGRLGYATIRLVDDDAVVEWSGTRAGMLVAGTPADLAAARESPGIVGSPIAADPHGTEVFEGTKVLDSASGAEKANYPPANKPTDVYSIGRESGATAVFLTSELAEIHTENQALALRILPRAASAPPTVHPFVAAGNCGGPVLLAAPGATVVFCPRAPDNAPVLFGFAP
ncbi:PQQ-like beta-propeller repeat protein [Nocardia zapadnayensis]|nr:PQQ-binding-like beta-propeller repeat protein [Nocardia zapadnayensis]MCX0271913.1 PQQ-like beta-propeller repeat protein [Nocardia zapadnayensis]